MTKTRHLNTNMARMNIDKTLTEKSPFRSNHCRPTDQGVSRVCARWLTNSQTEIDQHNIEAQEQKRIHITESIISGSKYQRNTI